MANKLIVPINDDSLARMRIVGVKLKPVGGNKFTIEVISEPDGANYIIEKPKPKYTGDYNYRNSFEFSFEAKVDPKTVKKIRELF